jgi:Peptidase C13 family
VRRFFKLTTLGRVAALSAALLVLDAWAPRAPLPFVRGGRHIHAQALARGRGGAAESEAARFERSQQALLQAEIARLAPPNKSAINVYAVGIAGYADQDVFIKELDGGLAVFDRILSTRNRTVRLVNDRGSEKTVPLASQRNFSAAVRAIGATMNKNADILLLLMTSHGDRRGFVLRLPDTATSELTPQELAETLDKEGIKNRIVIVSACFSGIFVPPLANDNTIVLTAADAAHASFGCAAEREWTYFGDAFFRQSVRPGIDLRRAFDNARILIHGWEMMDNAPPSNPQGHFGPALVNKLAPFFAAAPNAGQ